MRKKIKNNLFFIFRKGWDRAVDGSHLGFGQGQYATAGIEKR